MTALRVGPLHVALCALLLAGCSVGGTQGAGDVAGRQAPAAVPGDVAPGTLLSIAERVRANGDLSSAITFYRRAIILDPNLVKAYYGLGETLLAIGDANDAAEAFRAGLSKAAMDPKKANDPAGLRGLGLSLVALGQPASAIETLNQSIAGEPSARTYSALGVAYDLLGDADAASNAYKLGLALAPDDLDLLNNYGLSQALHGDFNGAVDTLRRVAKDGKASPRHRLNLALALGLAGRNDDAAQVARIDLDERAVRSNLAYYAQLRALSPQARAAAILRPGTPLQPRVAAATCDAPPCGTPALPGEKLSAVPTAPVVSKPLSTPNATKPAPLSPAPQKKSNAGDGTASGAKPDKVAPVPPTEGAKPATPSRLETPPATQDNPRTSTSASSANPAADDNKTTAKGDDTSHEVVAANNEPAGTTDKPQPLAQDEFKPQPAVGEPTPLTTIPDTKPMGRTDDATAAVAAAASEPTVTSDKPLPVAQDEPKSLPAAGESSPLTAVPDVKPTDETVNAAPADAIPPSTGREAMASAVPSAPASSAPTPPANPVIAASAVAMPGLTGKHAWIQVASFRSEQNAHTAWQNMTNGNQDLLRYVQLSVKRVDLGADKGTFYVLRIGPLASADQARDLCVALKDRKIDCMVAK